MAFPDASIFSSFKKKLLGAVRKEMLSIVMFPSILSMLSPEKSAVILKAMSGSSYFFVRFSKSGWKSLTAAVKLNTEFFP